MNKKLFLASVIFCFAATMGQLIGQTNSCGTYISNSQKNLETKFTITEGTPTQSLPQVNRTISIAAFIVKERNSPYFKTNLDSIVSILNVNFRPIALSFKICSKTIVNNFQFDNINPSLNTKDLTVQYAEQNTINLYLVSGLIDKKGSSVCGYTYMPGDTGKNYIFMNKGCINSTSLTHQLGHFFNLYHTNETEFGEELPDGTNCNTAGDRCCDTNASPDLSITGMVTNCIYTGTVKRSTQLFSPSTKNMMALSSDICRCNFSRTQFLRILQALNNYRNYLR